MNNQHIRSFIALELPETLKAYLCEIQQTLKSKEFVFVKWVAPAGIHLTLKFLGNIQMQRVDQIVEVLTGVAASVSPFVLETDELGVFPSFGRPTVLWIGLGGDLESLVTLQKQIDDALEPLGFTKEKRVFTPHLTLARLRETASITNKRDFGEAVKRIQMDIRYKIEINSISLMRSQLLPQGAVYSRIADIALS